MPIATGHHQDGNMTPETSRIGGKTMKSGKTPKSKPGSSTTDKPKTFLHGLGQKATSTSLKSMSANRPEADIAQSRAYVRLVPEAAIP